MTFIFDDYFFDSVSGEAVFCYRVDQGQEFTERVQFAVSKEYDAGALDRTLFLAFLLIGTSYYKAFPTPDVQFPNHVIDAWQARFLDRVYQEGLSQFAYENNLTRDDLAHFVATGEAKSAVAYDGAGVLSLQSGGKDSLLVATLLNERKIDFSSLYISSSQHYPQVIDAIGSPVRLVGRHIDREALAQAAAQGGKNGHVPVTFIVLAIALVQMVLDGKSIVLAAIGHEGEEPHAWIGDLPVNHQWSKTWAAEQLFAEYVQRYVSPDISVGSPLRQYSELAIVERFARYAWRSFGHSFSSCNQANYSQGQNNATLTWCGACPKCANSYLLFAAFVPRPELDAVFDGKNLMQDAALTDTFKGLLGIDGTMKPFECIGEVDELRRAYHLALEAGYRPLSFTVPDSIFSIEHRYPMQEWANEYVLGK